MRKFCSQSRPIPLFVLDVMAGNAFLIAKGLMCCLYQSAALAALMPLRSGSFREKTASEHAR